MKYLRNIGNELAVYTEGEMHYIFDSDGREIIRYDPKETIKNTLEKKTETHFKRISHSLLLQIQRTF